MREPKAHKLTSGFRKIHESRCAEPACEFNGKPAQQGVCFSRLDNPSTKYIDATRRYADARMAEIKAVRTTTAKKPSEWTEYLEGALWCCWMNEQFTLDELVHLRAQVGTLTNRLEKANKKTAK